MALTLILLFSLLVSPTGTQQGGVRAEQAGRLCLLSWHFLCLPGFLLTADSCLAIQQILFPLAPAMADGKGGFNELLFSCGD